MCTYNGAKYIREQLDSIVNQTYPIFELIIQDDCSTDETISICREYAEKYSFIKLYINESQKGVNLNFHSAALRAMGDYIAISDQDDIWCLDKIEKQVQKIGDFYLLGSHSQPFTTDKKIELTSEDSRVPNFGLERMIYLTVFPGHTMIFQRKLLELVPELIYWENHICYDRVYQLTAAAYEQVAFQSEKLVFHRRHDRAITYTKPLDYKRGVCNIIKSVFRTFKCYLQVRPHIRDFYTNIYNLLKNININTISKSNALHIAFNQSQSGIIPFLKLTYWNIRMRNKIFYTPEQNKIISILRGAYFAISCSDYFRYYVK